MLESKAPREINAGELSAKITHSGREILGYEIIYPRINARTAAERRVNQYHYAQARNFERLIRSQYLPPAREQLRGLAAHGSFAPLEIGASFQVMYNGPRVLSVFTDTFFQLRHEGARLARSARTYDMGRGTPLLLPQLFARGCLFRRILQSALHREIEAEAQKNPGCYYADWAERYRPALADSAFYLAEDSLIIFFQQEVIAGKNAGIPSFRVPLSLFQGQLNLGLGGGEG